MLRICEISVKHSYDSVMAEFVICSYSVSAMRQIKKERVIGRPPRYGEKVERRDGVLGRLRRGCQLNVKTRNALRFSLVHAKFCTSFKLLRMVKYVNLF